MFNQRPSVKILRGFCSGFHYFFFFQAEDGIRDRTVTGVQTCALPISSWNIANYNTTGGGGIWRQCAVNEMDMDCKERFRLELTPSRLTLYVNATKYFERSEERRVGKEGRGGGGRELEKKENRSKDNYE